MNVPILISVGLHYQLHVRKENIFESFQCHFIANKRKKFGTNHFHDGPWYHLNHVRLMYFDLYQSEAYTELDLIRRLPSMHSKF